MRSRRSFVIAEAGINHCGSVDIAVHLVEAAAAAGADAVKFQIFRADEVVDERAELATYQAQRVDGVASQLDMLKRLELCKEDFAFLRERAQDLGLVFLATAFDFDSLSFLTDELHVSRLKIPSGDITNLPLILECVRSDLPLLISTGMSTLDEVERSLDTVAYGILEHGSPDSFAQIEGLRREATAASEISRRVTLLQCTTAYPTDLVDVNLLAMVTLREEFDVDVGFSDHTLGWESALAAVALGATVIEKHLTLDRKWEGPDHFASLEPADFAQMLTGIRNVEKALGSSEKRPTRAEFGNRTAARRSLVAAQSIRAGEVIMASDIRAVRPGDGLSPKYWWDVVGSIAHRDFMVGEQIDLSP